MWDSVTLLAVMVWPVERHTISFTGSKAQICLPYVCLDTTASSLSFGTWANGVLDTASALVIHQYRVAELCGKFREIGKYMFVPFSGSLDVNMVTFVVVVGKAKLLYVCL